MGACVAVGLFSMIENEKGLVGVGKKFSLRIATVVGVGPLTSVLPLPRAWNIEYLRNLRGIGHLGYLRRLEYLRIPSLVGARTLFPLPREGLA